MKSHGSVLARPFEENDLAGVLTMLRDVLGDWPRLPIACGPLDHLRWKLVDRPYARLADVVAVDGERIVGTMFRWLEPARLHGQPVAIGSGSDIAVHPEYRGKKIYSLIRDVEDVRAAGTYALQVGHTQSDVIRSRQAFHGWLPVMSPMEVMARRLGRLRAEPRQGSFVVPGVRDIRRFDQATDALFEASAPACQFIIDRQAARMNWRYLDARAGEFRVRGAYEGDRVVGYAVIRLAGRRSFLADLLVMPGRDDVGDELIGDALQSAQDSGAEVMRAWMQRTHPYRPALERAGFRREAAVDLTYRVGTMTEAEAAFLDERASWVHYMLGDTDLV